MNKVPDGLSGDRDQAANKKIKIPTFLEHTLLFVTKSTINYLASFAVKYFLYEKQTVL